MTVDNQDSGDTITESTETTATSESTSPVTETATSSTAAPTSAETADSSGPASAATQANADANSSLTPANTSLQAAKTQPQESEESFKKRYADLRRREQEITRQNQQYQAQLQQFQGVDPNAVRAWQQAQMRTQQEQLPVWNRQNPNNPRFQQTQAKWAAYKEAINRAQTPEQKAAIRDTLGATFTPDEVQQVQSWENHQREFQANFASDPAGTIAHIVDQRVQQAIHQHTQRAQAEQSVGQWFSDQANQAIVQRYGQQMMAALQTNSWEMVKNYFVNQARLDGLQTRVGEAQKAETAAKEQQRLLQGQAAVTRDPKVEKKVDPMKVAKQRGIQPGTDEYWDLLHELKESGLI